MCHGQGHLAPRRRDQQVSRWRHGTASSALHSLGSVLEQAANGQGIQKRGNSHSITIREATVIADAAMTYPDAATHATASASTSYIPAPGRTVTRSSTRLPSASLISRSTRA